MAPGSVVKNPYETSFENLTTSAGQGAKKIAKDLKEHVLGPQKTLLEETGISALPTDKKHQVEQETQANLQRINNEIDTIRKEKKKREQEKAQQEEQVKQAKKQQEEKKKKEDPVWLKALKGQMGSQEGPKNVAG